MNKYNPADYDSFIDSNAAIVKSICELKKLYAEEQKRRYENSKKEERRAVFIAFAFAVGCFLIVWQWARICEAAGFN